MVNEIAARRRSIPRIAPLYRFQWEAAQEGYVLLFPEGMVQLNATAAEILQLCDGTRSAGEIITRLEQKFQPEAIAEEVDAFLQSATEGGWLEWRDPEAE